MNFANIQPKQSQLMQEEKLCSPEHTWKGVVPTIDDKDLIGSSCECGKFILQMSGCRCNGTRKVEYVENKNYKPQL